MIYPIGFIFLIFIIYIMKEMLIHLCKYINYKNSIKYNKEKNYN